MFFTRQNIFLYLLIVAYGTGYSLCWPLFKPRTHSKTEAPVALSKEPFRSTRQIVQPTWLNPGQQLVPIDPIVHVNEKALDEADMIRKSIQKAVDEGTYAVTGEESKANDSIRPSVNTTPVSLTHWNLKFQKLWQNWAQNLFKGFRN